MMHHCSSSQVAARYASLLLSCIVVVSVLAGCHRAYYRDQADGEAYSLIAEKASHPHWNLQNFDIYVDPRSRMFDPFDPDREPMPPDDPAAHRLMHSVDNKKGYPHWHANGDTPIVENPDWQAYLPLDEDGVLVLNADRAIELALLHSRDYQRNLESLYLSALDVSFERFRFDTQFFGGYQVDGDWTGPLRRGNGGESRSDFTAATLPASAGGIRAQRMFTTGADLVVGLANSLMWQFSGPDTYAATTLLDFSLVQPLLRNAGRDRIMETLTLSERTLLANVRQMERFRRGFYLETITGVNAGGGPNRRGGVLGGSGFQGFTGTGGGGFGRLGGGGGDFGGGGGTGGGQAGGFMGLLQQQQEIRNQEDNLAGLRTNYFNLLITLQELLTTIPDTTEAVVGQRLQVAQSREAVLNAESRLLNTRVDYQNSLDQFKINIGLPPDVCVRIDDPMLSAVNIVDPAFRPIQNRMGEIQQDVGDLILAMLPKEDEFVLRWNDDLAANLQKLRGLLREIDEVREYIMEGDDAQIRRVEADGIKLGERLTEVLDSVIERREDSPNGATELAALRQDAEALKQILQLMKQDETWMAPLQRWKQLDDFRSDVERLKRQLEAGESFVVDWMSSDVNPLTKELYQLFADPISQLPAQAEAQRMATIAQLLAQIDAHADQYRDAMQQIEANHLWIARFVKWRMSPDEVEMASQNDEAVELRRLKRLFVQFADTMIAAPTNFGTLPAKIATFEQRIDDLLDDGPNLTDQELTIRFRDDISPAIPQELVDLTNNVLELSLVQARDRTETVSLIEIDIHPVAALGIAEQNRRDWMNARASLVDTWRLIEFNADALESSLDVVFQGDIQNEGDNPLRLRGPTGRLRVGLQFDAPLTRLDERNRYREALIQFQQARRDYYAFVDRVSQGLRQTIRTIELQRRNFEIRREAVRVADLQIELNDARRRIRELSGQPSGETAARDAVSALSALLTAQNDFLSVWVTYEVLRRTLDFNMGTMQLDENGNWIDPGAIGPKQGYPGIEVDANYECWPGELKVVKQWPCDPPVYYTDAEHRVHGPTGGPPAGVIPPDRAPSATIDVPRRRIQPAGSEPQPPILEEPTNRRSDAATPFVLPPVTVETP